MQKRPICPSRGRHRTSQLLSSYGGAGSSGPSGLHFALGFFLAFFLFFVRARLSEAARTGVIEAREVSDVELTVAVVASGSIILLLLAFGLSGGVGAPMQLLEVSDSNS